MENIGKYIESISDNAPIEVLIEAQKSALSRLENNIIAGNAIENLEPQIDAVITTGVILLRRLHIQVIGRKKFNQDTAKMKAAFDLFKDDSTSKN